LPHLRCVRLHGLCRFWQQTSPKLWQIFVDRHGVLCQKKKTISHSARPFIPEHHSASTRLSNTATNSLLNNILFTARYIFRPEMLRHLTHNLSSIMKPDYILFFVIYTYLYKGVLFRRGVLMSGNACYVLWWIRKFLSLVPKTGIPDKYLVTGRYFSFRGKCIVVQILAACPW
jgi:hypothetical protein